MEAVDYIELDRPQTAAEWLEGLVERVGAPEELAKRGRVIPAIAKAAH